MCDTSSPPSAPTTAPPSGSASTGARCGRAWNDHALYVRCTSHVVGPRAIGAFRGNNRRWHASWIALPHHHGARHMSTTRTALAISGLALVAGFFMPWEGVTGTFNGYHLATSGLDTWMQLATWFIPLAGL